MRPRIAAGFRQRTLAEWLEILHAHDVPATVVNSLDQALADPQLTAREMFFEDGAGHTQVAFPVKFSGTPWQAARPAPGIGEHNAQLLAGIGFPAEHIDRARADGVI